MSSRVHCIGGPRDGDLEVLSATDMARLSLDCTFEGKIYHYVRQLFTHDDQALTAFVLEGIGRDEAERALARIHSRGFAEGQEP